jgi:hypothetical protein
MDSFSYGQARAVTQTLVKIFDIFMSLFRAKLKFLMINLWQN